MEKCDFPHNEHEHFSHNEQEFFQSFLVRYFCPAIWSWVDFTGVWWNEFA
jgi:hypothetical protein